MKCLLAIFSVFAVSVGAAENIPKTDLVLAVEVPAKICTEATDETKKG